MKGIIVVAITFTLANVLAYHDPDLNYHLSQIQKLDGCDNKGGYAYPAPAVQLTTAGVKVAPGYNQHGLAAPTYQYSNAAGYSSAASAGYTSGAYTSGAAYQAVAPQLTYASQPAAQYQAFVSHGYAPAPTYTTQVQSEQREVHGYATSAGLSSASSSTRTVIPQATYAQAPILAKITGAPLIAKFAVAPAKTTYVTQNLAAQQQASYATGSLAKASLNSYSTVQHGGPVVTQLYAAPAAAKYAASPALRVQYVQQQYITPARYTAVAGPSTIHAQAGPISALTPVAPVAPQYRGQPQYVSQYSAGVQYAAPAVTQYAAPAVAQYAAPAVAQYAAPAVTGHYTQYSTPVVTQHYAATAARHYSAPAVVKSAPVVSHYSAPAVAQYATNSVSSGHYSAPVAHVQAAPAVAHVAHVAAPAVAHVAAPAHVAPVIQVHAGHHSGHVKNVHKEFVENYDAHPRYAYEYSVNDPHTGDVKQQKEERDGEVVKGQYSLVEPDGSVRTVNYVADWETGFHADVRNSKDSQH